MSSFTGLEKKNHPFFSSVMVWNLSLASQDNENPASLGNIMSTDVGMNITSHYSTCFICLIIFFLLVEWWLYFYVLLWVYMLLYSKVFLFNTVNNKLFLIQGLQIFTLVYNCIIYFSRVGISTNSSDNRYFYSKCKSR